MTASDVGCGPGAWLDLLEDDSIPAVRSWIERRADELPQGFAGAVRAWLLVLLDGDVRSVPDALDILSQLRVSVGCNGCWPEWAHGVGRADGLSAVLAVHPRGH